MRVQSVSFDQNKQMQMLEHIGTYWAGTAQGLEEYTVDSLDCIFGLLLRPLDSFYTFLQALWNYKQTARDIRQVINETLATYPTSTTQERARLHAVFVAETLAILVPINLSAGWLSKSSRISRAINPVIDTAKQAASAVKKRVIKHSNAYFGPVGRYRMRNFDPVSVAEWFAADQKASN